MTREEENELIAKAQAGDKKAREEILKIYMPIAWYWGNRLGKQNRADIEDYKQIALIAINHSIDKWNPERGNAKFLSVATTWIKAFIFRKYYKNTLLFFPSSARAQALSYKKMQRLRLRASSAGVNLDDAEVAKFLGISQVQIDCERYAAGAKTVVSLNVHLRGEGAEGTKTQFMDLITRSNLEKLYGVEEEEPDSELISQIKERLRKAPSRYQIVIHRLYLDPNTKNLREIGAELGLSSERVRQIKDLALEWLKKEFGQPIEADPC